jgi:hypothetical protein
LSKQKQNQTQIMKTIIKKALAFMLIGVSLTACQEENVPPRPTGSSQLPANGDPVRTDGQDYYYDENGVQVVPAGDDTNPGKKKSTPPANGQSRGTVASDIMPVEVGEQ